MNLKENLKRYGFTISSVANKLGVTQSALSQQINNNTISFAKVEQIASIVGVPVCELISEETRNAPNSLVCPHCGKPIEVHLTASEV